MMGQNITSMFKANDSGDNNAFSTNYSRNNVFKVRNFDEAGIERTSGRLIILPYELVLHQKATDSAPAETFRWPLRSLRRYGYDSQTFSFESGRRCITGPGVYAFKCKKAIALFNTLQMHIQNATANDTTQGPHTGDNILLSSLQQPRYTIASEINTTAVQQCETSGQPAAYSRLHLYVNSNLLPPIHAPGTSGSPSCNPTAATAASNRADYVNTAVTVVTRFDSLERLNSDQIHSSDQRRIQYVELDLQRTSQTDSSEDIYFNVTQNGLVSPKHQPDQRNSGSNHDYMNLGLGMSPMESPKPVSGDDTITSSASYTMIDFAKTKALAARTSYEDAGIRKTRHNSSIDDLIGHRE